MATDVFFGPDITEAKSEAEILGEIEELGRQQHEISERLNTFRGGPVRNNRLRPGPGASNVQRNFTTLGRGRGKHPRGPINNPEEMEVEESPAKKRLLSSVVKVNDGDSKMDDELFLDPPEENPAAKSVTERYQSSKHAEKEKTPVPRVIPVVNDAGLVKRNRRMFGALLLGTLEKFKEEDKKLQDSEAFMRRSNSLKRAEQKAMEEKEKLRLEARQKYQETRKRDLVLKARLQAKTEEKQLQVMYMRWNSHQTKLSSFLRTKAKPCVYFVPVKPCDVTDRILEDQKKELEEWRSDKIAELKKYHEEVKEEYLNSATMSIDGAINNLNNNIDNSKTSNGKDDTNYSGNPDSSHPLHSTVTLVLQEEGKHEKEDRFNNADDTAELRYEPQDQDQNQGQVQQPARINDGSPNVTKFDAQAAAPEAAADDENNDNHNHKNNDDNANNTDGTDNDIDNGEKNAGDKDDTMEEDSNFTSALPNFE